MFKTLLSLIAICNLCLLVCATNEQQYWHRTGVGAPLRHHSDFSRVGGECPPNTVIAGVRFSRGGCYRVASWDRKEFVQPCDESVIDLEWHEGLYLELKCLPSAVRLGESNWMSTGVGAPLRMHSSFERIGATCPSEFVATGVRFARGGCHMNSWWRENAIDLTECEENTDNTEGLLMQLKCTKLPRLRGFFDWHASGIGGPIKKHSDFVRVGGQCTAGGVMNGISFERGGCHVDASWESGTLHIPKCPENVGTENNEGLSMMLRCGEVSGLLADVDSIESEQTASSSDASEEEEKPAVPAPAPRPPMSPLPPNPIGVPDVLTGVFPFADSPALPFNPINERLFITQLCDSLGLPYSYARVLSQEVLPGRVERVFFQLFSPPGYQHHTSELLIQMVHEQDKLLQNTYFGISGVTLEVAQIQGPAAPEPQAEQPNTAAPVPIDRPQPPPPLPLAPPPPPQPQPSQQPQEIEPWRPEPEIELVSIRPLETAFVPLAQSESSESSIEWWIILGAALAIVAVVVALVGIALVIFYHRRRRQQTTIPPIQLHLSVVSTDENSAPGVGFTVNYDGQSQVFHYGQHYVAVSNLEAPSNAGY